MVRTAAPVLSNADVAAAMREMADRLQRAGESPFRVAAYRRAAATFARTPHDLNRLLAASGEEGLRQLRGIGPSLARSTARLLRTGRWAKLERMRTKDRGQELLKTLPGVGPRIAQRVESALGARSLEEVFAAACDGRLRRVPGLGQKRLRAIRESLATRLGAAMAPPLAAAVDEPDVEELLSIDAEYRQRVAAGRLPTVAPRLYNPTGSAWLPVLQTQRQGRPYTAHFANTARSHALGRFQDWVVITCDEKAHYGVWTVITAAHGELRGKRLVMHREADCRAYYRRRKVQRELPLGSADATKN